MPTRSPTSSSSYSGAGWAIAPSLAPELIDSAFVHEAQHDLDSNWLQPGCSSGCFIGAGGQADLTLEIHEIQEVPGRPRIAQRTVMRLEFDPIKLAQFPETVRLVPGVAPTHSGVGAKFGKPKAAIESFVLMAYEAVITIDVVSDEDPVRHEPHEAVRDIGEYRLTANHLVRDAGDLSYLGRDGSLGIHQGMPLVDDLMVADLDRTDFGYPIAGRPTARRLDVDHDIVLLGIESVIDPADLRRPVARHARGR
jgi:hypothetical protein